MSEEHTASEITSRAQYRCRRKHKTVGALFSAHAGTNGVKPDQ
jgi:hypothetical protein